PGFVDRQRVLEVLIEQRLDVASVVRVEKRSPFQREALVLVIHLLNVTGRAGVLQPSKCKRRKVGAGGTTGVASAPPRVSSRVGIDLRTAGSRVRECTGTRTRDVRGVPRSDLRPNFQSMAENDTPLMAQWRTAKARHPDAIVFFRVGDF